MLTRLAMSAALLLVPLAASATDAPTGRDAVLDGAFRDAQVATGSRTALALSRSAARLAAVDPELSALILARQTASSLATTAERKWVMARTAVPADPIEIARTSKEADEARAEFNSADAALAKRSPGYAQLTGIAPLHIAEAQALLRNDEAILVIHSNYDHTYGFAIAPHGADWTRVDVGRVAVDGEVRALRAALDPDGRVAKSTGKTSFPRARAFALYQQLWAPALPIIGEAKIVFVVADGALGGLPLAVLPTQAPSGRDGDPRALSKTHWLARDVALVTLPSVGSLRALRASRVSIGAKRPFAGFGDPLLDGAPSTASPRGFDLTRGIPGADVATTLRAFPRLPGSKAELVSLAFALGAEHSTVVTGAEATEAAVKSARLSDVSVIAFATHGLLAGEMSPKAEPALVMTPPAIPSGTDDGLLTASEAAGLHLAADWVVLSACNTASADGTTNGEGLSGLVRGFFSGGARAVLASHWRVRDDVVELLTVGTIARWKAHPEQGRAKALQGAMLAMIDDRKHPEHADPSLWAPFVVAGEGR